MADQPSAVVHGIVVEEEVEFTLAELGRACRVDRAQLIALVDEGVLQPRGSGPDEWRFGGTALRRARSAQRLARDLELSPAGTALVLDLLDQIEALRSRLHRAGLR
ncbi:MAG TPA: chaperone modulator CbpM [Albitalea sp.]|nr:chaperone modulator CbpM [Albitalea sp.]